MTRFLLLLLLCLVAGCGKQSPPPPSGEAAAEKAAKEPAPAPTPLPDLVRVRLETGEGPIVVELDAKRAPVTAANFLAYVEEDRFDGTTIYRVAPTKGA